jgi:polysaccharide biosynthesis/export protein
MAGCSSLPSQGPSASQVATRADEQAVNRDYLVVNLSPPVVSITSAYRINPLSQYFADARPAPTQVVGVGDILTITLFEAGEGGLFASDNGARVTFVNPVSSDGNITVPYAGQVRAAGRTPQQMEQAIVSALEGKAIQPQAIVVVSTNNSQSVILTGDISSGRYPLLPGGERILDIIAKAGGTKQQSYAERVQLTRNGRIGEVFLQKLIDYPSENVYVLPGDRLHVTHDPETFTIMGAIGSTGQFPFERERVTLMEAVARSGGLSETTADRTGLFVFRYEPDAIAKLLRKDYNGRFGAQAPVVYRIDMGDPNAFFYANSFLLRDKDLIYVADSPATELTKIIAVLNGIRSVGSVARDVRAFTK